MPAEAGSRLAAAVHRAYRPAISSTAAMRSWAGSLGLMATIGEGDFCRNPQSGVILPGINGMQAVPPGYGWLVGDGGWIALTGNRGNSWRPPLGTLPPANGPLRLLGAGRSRTEMLDRRQPRQPRLLHARRRENLVRISHGHHPAAAGRSRSLTTCTAGPSVNWD